MCVRCRICGGDTVGQLWGGSVCISCGSISVTDLPSSEQLERYYLKFNEAYHGGGRAKGAKLRQRKYAYAHLGLILPLGCRRRLLDIGSSNNPFPNIALEHNYDVTVLDYMKPVEIPDSIRFVQGRTEDEHVVDKLGKQSFDIVTAFQVIEHCRNPKLMAELMVELCTYKGFIIIATPLVDSFSERYALGRSPWWNPPEHIHLLSEDGMIRMLDSLGCKLVVAKRYELNALRWVLRYGLAYLEGWRGFIVKKVFPAQWREARDYNKSKVQEFIYYVFKRS